MQPVLKDLDLEGALGERGLRTHVQGKCACFLVCDKHICKEMHKLIDRDESRQGNPFVNCLQDVQLPLTISSRKFPTWRWAASK